MFKLFKKIFFGERGSLFAEVIIALGLVLVGLISLITLITTSIKHTTDSEDRFVASFLAIEGIEVVKNIIDGYAAAGLGWNQVWSNFTNETFEVDYKSDKLLSNQDRFLDFDGEIYSYGVGESTKFKRKIDIRRDNSGEMIFIEVTSRISWTTRDGIGAMDEMVDTFYKWRFE